MEIKFHDPVRQSALISNFITSQAGRPSITRPPPPIDLTGLSQFASTFRRQQFYSLLNDRVQVTVQGNQTNSTNAANEANEANAGLIQMELSAEAKLTYQGELLVQGPKIWLHGSGKLEAWVDGVKITSIVCGSWRRNVPTGELVIRGTDH